MPFSPPGDCSCVDANPRVVEAPPRPLPHAYLRSRDFLAVVTVTAPCARASHASFLPRTPTLQAAWSSTRHLVRPAPPPRRVMRQACASPKSRRCLSTKLHRAAVAATPAVAPARTQLCRRTPTHRLALHPAMVWRTPSRPNSSRSRRSGRLPLRIRGAPRLSTLRIFYISLKQKLRTPSGELFKSETKGPRPLAACS